MKNLVNKISTIAVITALTIGVYPLMTFAAPLTSLSNDMSRQKVSENSSHDINFTIPNAILAGGSIDVTFPDFDFTSIVAGDVTATGSPTVSFSGTNNSTVTLTYPGGQAAGAITIAIADTNTLNPSVSGNQVITIEVDIDNDSTVDDNGVITVPIIDEDQIQITATVDQVLFFDVRDSSDTDNTIGFGSLTTGSSRWATDDGAGSGTATPASEFEAGTNATNGYTVAVEGATLTSGSDTIDAVNPAATPNPSIEQFGLAVATSTETGNQHGTIETDYTGGTYFHDTAAPNIVVNQSNPADNSTYDVSYLANVTSGTEAGSYSTSLTYTMTANF